ncbi:MAG TPA: hypothetical protein VN039_08105 [Nitrospira sp.]|nr:hypothetical protein [Nitrospira sp.]
MTKDIKRVDLSKLTPEQKQAVAQFYRDCKQAAPHVKQMQDTMHTLFQAWLQSPQWTVHEGTKPDGAHQDVWHVKPEINYVDRIEGVS